MGTNQQNSPQLMMELLVDQTQVKLHVASTPNSWAITLFAKLNRENYTINQFNSPREKEAK